MKFLEGKKTYISAIALFVVGGSLYMGLLTQDQANALSLMIGGIFGVSIRSAMNNIK